MKQMIPLLSACLLLTGCGFRAIPEETVSQTISLDVAVTETAFPTVVSETTIPTVVSGPVAVQEQPDDPSRFDSVTEILLSDEGIRVNGAGETEAVFTTNDIIYYKDRETYDSGNPYGEGSSKERHSREEAAAHTVVNITRPGAYRVSGRLSAGQIRVDLGEDAYEDETAVVELILSNAEIACSVAPAILFLNTYECDGSWSAENAQPKVDTSAAGANLILENRNVVYGSHVAKIFKDKEGEKKLWKQDGAIYSYMSMNVSGTGSLDLYADNEGMDTELHLTIHSGDISIYSGNDGINTNEDGVSVTTINGGNVTIFAGLGEEGDGIDSNGYLVINGGTVVAAANPKADAGLDSDLGSYIHGGTVVAMGSTMDWAESDSKQVTMNLQFAGQQEAGSKISITKEDGTEFFSFDNSGKFARKFSGLILSHADLIQGETYHVSLDGVQMTYTGTDLGRFGRRPGRMPEDFDPENMPEGFDPGKMPEGFDPSRTGSRGPRPEDGWESIGPPEDLGGFDGRMPEGMEPPERPEGDFDDRYHTQSGEPSTEFYMNDMVNAFSGVTTAE